MSFYVKYAAEKQVAHASHMEVTGKCTGGRKNNIVWQTEPWILFARSSLAGLGLLFPLRYVPAR